LDNNNNIYNSKILIVDDEMANIRLLEKSLESAGFQNFRSEQNSKNVRKICSSFRPDLILLDLRMPKPDGFEIMKEIREDDEDPPVIIVLTAENESYVRMKALNEGALDFLSKPFDYNEVILRTKNILKLKNQLSAGSKEEDNANKSAREFSRKNHDVDIDIIQSLSKINRAHFKDVVDNYSRVSHFSYLLANKIGLSIPRSQNIKIASSTYDIGKIAVPMSILDKPGELKPEEWEIIRNHTILGAELLSGSDSLLMKMARQIALEHHEKWNGKGYPKGLKRDEISLEARIVAIADGFDSVTSDRVYRPRISFDEGVSYIKEKSGTDFDPYLVSRFVAMIPTLKSVKEKYSADDKIKSSPFRNDYKFQNKSIEKIKAAIPILLNSHDDDKLLLVDDIPAMRSAYSKVARQLGYKQNNIFEAPSGSIALKKLEENRVRLIITDLYMPKMTGLELVTRVREIPEFRDIPIIVVSEENRKEQILNIIQSGANQYLLKPFTSYQLEEKINQVLINQGKTEANDDL